MECGCNLFMCACMHVCVCVCACMRACVRACVRACMCVNVMTACICRTLKVLQALTEWYTINKLLLSSSSEKDDEVCLSRHYRKQTILISYILCSFYTIITIILMLNSKTVIPPHSPHQI